MKSKDYAIIAIVVVVSIVISLEISQKIIVPSKNKNQQVTVVQPITPTFTVPSSQFFNSNSIDPAQLITIGQNNNTNPF